MKIKELKKIAQEILNLENIIDANESPEKVRNAQNRIMEISGKIGPEDMLRIDEIIQEQIQKKS